MNKQFPVIVFLSCFGVGCDRDVPDPAPIVYTPAPTVDTFIESILANKGGFADVSFNEVIKASTGNQVLPIDPGDPADQAILDAVRSALDIVVKDLSRDDSLTNRESRINEVSSHFEEALRHQIGKAPGISCDYPKTAEGKTQRSGYPDLRIVHEETGRVAYLDPKLVESGSLKSSLRTFYFTPKVETNKVLEDAHHLLVGIEHDGNTGKWKYSKWHLIDLTDFRVRLKAEFQASNKDLYQDHLTILEGINDDIPRPESK